MNELDRSVLRQLYVDTVSDCAIILLDVEGNVQSWNAGAQAIWGYPAGEILGRHYSNLLPNNHVARVSPLTLLDHARVSGRCEEAGPLLAKDGTKVEAHSAVTAVYDQQQRLLGFGILTRAIAVTKPGAVVKLVSTVPPKKREKILVVDDDEMILKITLAQLTSFGYQVFGASSGTQALELLASVSDIDLLFTDVSMPGDMGGREVAEKAWQMCPSLKVLFASGYLEHALVRNGALVESVPFLVKPYRKRELAQKVREVLDGTVS